VTMAGNIREPEAVVRGEIALATPADEALFHPYHVVMDLPLERATALVAEVERRIADTAAAALNDLVAWLRHSGIEVKAVGVVGAPERNLASIGSPHIRAHAAEGVLFRRVLETAAEANGLRCERFPERDLDSLAASRLGVSVAAVKSHLARIGERLGPPWRADEKSAAMAGWGAPPGPPPRTPWGGEGPGAPRRLPTLPPPHPAARQRPSR